MAEELQSLIEKINRDGVEKAKAEAGRIVSDAKDQAAALLKSAKDEAGRLAADAAKKADESAAHARETMKQAARDAVKSVQAAVRQTLEKLLTADVEAALADSATVTALVGDAVRDIAGKGEVTAGPEIAAALKAQLAAKPEFTVVLDEMLGAGFTVKLDGGRVEYDFTAATIAAELARRLRPDLAKLMAEAQD